MDSIVGPNTLMTETYTVFDALEAPIRVRDADGFDDRRGKTLTLSETVGIPWHTRERTRAARKLGALARRLVVSATTSARVRSHREITAMEAYAATVAAAHFARAIKHQSRLDRPSRRRARPLSNMIVR